MFYDRVLKVENVGASKTALITFGCNATYDRITLLLGTTGAPGTEIVAADLEEIRILANGVEIFKDTGPNINSRNTYMGVSTDVAEVCVDFTEPHARGDAAKQYLASIPANLLQKLVMEVKLGAGVDVSGTLKCSAEYRGPTKNPFILKRRVFNFFAPGAADHDLFLPSGGNGGIIKRVWIHDGGNVTALRLRVGAYDAINIVDIAELGRIQTRHGLTPQALIDVLDFVADGNLEGALNTANGADVALRLTTSGAQAIVGYIDYIDPIGNLK